MAFQILYTIEATVRRIFGRRENSRAGPLGAVIMGLDVIDVHNHPVNRPRYCKSFVNALVSFATGTVVVRPGSPWGSNSIDSFRSRGSRTGRSRSWRLRASPQPGVHATIFIPSHRRHNSLHHGSCVFVGMVSHTNPIHMGSTSQL